MHYYNTKTDLEKNIKNNDILESYKDSLHIQSLKLEELEKNIFELDDILTQERASFSWRITYPLRLVRRVLKKDKKQEERFFYIIQKIKNVYREEGLKSVCKKIMFRMTDRPNILKKNHFIKIKNQENYNEKCDEKVLSEITSNFLIIAELSLTQCAHYRVWQKKEELESLGWHVSVTDWRNYEHALSLLQTCTNVIFYRTPSFENVKYLVSEAKRLGLSPWWEVDDLIFSRKYYLENSNIDFLNNKEKNELLNGTDLYRECLLLCGQAIASTDKLAELMKEFGASRVHVIENALDENIISAAKKIKERKNNNYRNTQEIRILYGSGTKTHDADFKVAALGLLQAMQENKYLTLHIVGDLNIPSECDSMKDRIVRVPKCDYLTYLELLSDANIAIAPLQESVFNDCKSNIKFLEASLFSIPTICSPSDAFVKAIIQNKNGIFARSTIEWKQAVLSVARSAELRRDIGAQAFRTALAGYSPDAVTQYQVAPLFGKPIPHKKEKISILSVNIYFSPNSFGGATFVAERMNAYLQTKKDIKTFVFTSRPDLEKRGESCLRYQKERTSILSVKREAPLFEENLAGLDNTQIALYFRQWVMAVRPDIVHFHAIAGLGLGMIRVCLEIGIPYVITLHDAWWLCDRHYMVTEKGQFCGQSKIDIVLCKACVPNARYLSERARFMSRALKNASYLLVPSLSHKKLYAEHGIPLEKIILNKNGFVWPRTKKLRRHSDLPLRFGYVGGAEKVKGYNLIKEVFETLYLSDWELLIVDNKGNLGIHSIQAETWSTKGSVKTLPPYSQESMDDFYNKIDVLLFPSQCKESYGLAVREALARDVWVIATNLGGQIEDIVDGENGTLIPADGKSAPLKKAVEDAINNKDFFSHYENKHKDKLTTFEKQAEELEGLLRAAVDMHNGLPT